MFDLAEAVGLGDAFGGAFSLKGASRSDCLLLRTVSQDALIEVMKVYTGFTDGRNKELEGTAEKVLTSMRREVDEGGQKERKTR